MFDPAAAIFGDRLSLGPLVAVPVERPRSPPAEPATPPRKRVRVDTSLALPAFTTIVGNRSGLAREHGGIDGFLHRTEPLPEPEPLREVPSLDALLSPPSLVNFAPQQVAAPQADAAFADELLRALAR